MYKLKLFKGNGLGVYRVGTGPECLEIFDTQETARQELKKAINEVARLKMECPAVELKCFDLQIGQEYRFDENKETRARSLIYHTISGQYLQSDWDFANVLETGKNLDEEFELLCCIAFECNGYACNHNKFKRPKTYTHTYTIYE